ncbi:MAG: MarR family transcriptional regulator [Bacteroidia bacterium]|nr:MarR family transcriptional regulator [Bacteroidia bacterium]
MSEQKSHYCGCLYYSANALARVMTKMADEAFAPTGLAPSYALMLMGINQKPGIQPKQISEYMQLTPSTVTRLLDKLEGNGLVEKQAQGRNTAIFPTEKSLALQTQIKACWQGLYAHYSSLLGEETAKNLTGEIYAAYQALTDSTASETPRIESI